MEHDQILNSEKAFWLFKVKFTLEKMLGFPNGSIFGN